MSCKYCKLVHLANLKYFFVHFAKYKDENNTFYINTLYNIVNILQTGKYKKN